MHSEAYMEAYDSLAKASIIDDPAYTKDEPIREKKPLLVKFQTTGECNLRCAYCFNDPSIRTNIMDEGVMRQSVDYVFSHPHAVHGVDFIIYGGEPLVRRELLYKTILYIRESQPKDCKTYVGIITNGTLFTPEDAVFFREHHVAVSVSFDGLPEFQDQNRRDDADAATSLGALRAIEMSKDGESLCILATVTRNMSARLLDIALYFEEHGIPIIEFMPLRMLGTAEDKDELSVNVKEYIQSLKDVVEAIEDGRIRNTSIRTILRMLLPLETRQTVHGEIGCVRCGAGRDTVFIDCKGNIMGCDMIPAELSPVIGDVWKGITDIDKLDGILQPQFTKLSGCKQCPWNRFCRSGCTGASASDQHGNNRKHTLTCAVNKELYPYLLEKLVTDGGVLHEYFLQHTTKN